MKTGEENKVEKNSVVYHKFTGDMPIIFVESFKEFANGFGSNLEEMDQGDVVNGTNTYCKSIGFSKSPLRFIVFEDRMMRTLFGSRKESVVEATLAMYSGNKKYPKNEQMAVDHAIQLAIKEERKNAFNILKTVYEQKFKESCPHQFKEDNINEAVVSGGPGAMDRKPAAYTRTKTAPPKAAQIDKEKKKKKPLEKSAKADAERKGLESKPGYGSLWGPKGKDIITHKIEDDKLITIPKRNVGDKDPQSGEDTDKEDVKNKQQSVAPQKPVQKKTVKMVRKDSPEYKSAQKKAGIEPERKGNDTTAAEDLGYEYTGDKDKNVDQIIGKAVLNSKTFVEDIGISDKEFESRNADHWINPKNKFKLPKSLYKNAKVPKKDLQLLERLISTKISPKTSAISHYTTNAGAGEIRSQAGELAMMTLTSIENDKDAEAVANEMMRYIRENSNYKGGKETDSNIMDDTVLTLSWVKASLQNRRAFKQRMNVTHGEGKWKLISAGWDTKEEFEAMTGKDYESNKGFSTDAYFTVQGPDGKIKLDEISLKKSTNVNFLNSGPKKFMEWDKSVKGSSIDVSKYLKDEQDRLRKAMTPKMVKKITALMEKNPKNSEVKNIKRYLKATGGDWDSAINKMSATGNKPLYKGLALLANSGDKEAKKFIDYHHSFPDKFRDDALEAIRTNKKLKENMLNEVRSEFPLKAVSENEETMCIGPYSVDRATMKEIFGTNNYSEISEHLDIYKGPPSFLGYAAKAGGKPIPIAQIRIRPSGKGYGGRMKFDMELHSKFAKRLKESHTAVYGSAEEPQKDPRT